MSAEISRRDQMAWATELALAIDAILQAVDNLKENFLAPPIRGSYSCCLKFGSAGQQPVTTNC